MNAVFCFSKMNMPQNQNLNDEDATVRTSLQKYILAKNAILEETRSLKVKIRVNVKRVDSLRKERDEARKRMDSFMEKSKHLRNDLLQQISSKAEIPELRLRYQHLLEVLQEKQREKTLILGEMVQKQTQSEHKMEGFLKQKMHENQMLLDKEMKEINNLETEFRELNDELPLHAQEQAFAEEIRSLEVEIESEVKNAETVTHDSCQKKERELMKQKQNLEERVKYLKTKLGFSTYQ